MTSHLLPPLWILASVCLQAAQDPPAPARPNPTEAELHEILKQSVEEGNLNFEPPADYVYVEERATRFLDSKGAVSPHSFSETREGMVLYGERFQRLIARDGKPLEAGKAREEQQKVDKEAEKRKREPAAAKASRLEAERQKRLACGADFVDGFRFGLLGVESVGGRPAWKVEAEPLPGKSPRCSGMQKVKQFHLTIWIDQADSKWAKAEAVNRVTVSLGGIVARIPAGALHQSIEMARRDDGTWLPARKLVHVRMKFMVLATFRLEGDSTYRDFRRFRTESRIVE